MDQQHEIATICATSLGEYDFVAHRLGYVHRVNDNLDVGFATEVSVGDYRYIRFGDALLISPQFSVRARLSERLDLSGNIGVTRSRVVLDPGKRTSTALAGNLGLCYREQRSSFCLNGQRQQAPTAVGGIRTQTSIGTSYSVRLSSVDTLSSGVSYSRASAPVTGVFQDVENIRIFGRVERRLNERMKIFASTGYSDNSDRINGQRSSFQGLVGIQFSFGTME
jgi:hypothetical protein